MQYTNIIGIVGLVIIILLYILMKKSQSKHPEKYHMLSKKRALLYVLLVIPALLGIYTFLKDVLETIWGYMTPI